MDRGYNRNHNYLSQKDYLIEEATTRCQKFFPPQKPPREIKDIVEAILTSQYKELNNKATTLTELEISGFGKFIFSPHKARRRIKNLQKGILTLQKTPNSEEKIARMENEIVSLNQKINQYEEFTRLHKTSTKGHKKSTADC